MIPLLWLVGIAFVVIALAGFEIKIEFESKNKSKEGGKAMKIKCDHADVCQDHLCPHNKNHEDKGYDCRCGYCGIFHGEVQCIEVPTPKIEDNDDIGTSGI